MNPSPSVLRKSILRDAIHDFLARRRGEAHGSFEVLAVAAFVEESLSTRRMPNIRGRPRRRRTEPHERAYQKASTPGACGVMEALRVRAPVHGASSLAPDRMSAVLDLCYGVDRGCRVQYRRAAS